jgi:RHS repeat-associated protein
LNFEAFSNEGTSNGRTSSETQFNTPLLTNSYNVDNEGTGRLKPQLNLLALVKLFKRQSTNLRTSSLSYNVQLKIEFYDKNKVLKSSNIETIDLNANTWASGLYELPAIQDHTIFYVKFSIINPNTFVVYLDNWKIEEKGKVILQENHYYPYGKEIVSLGKKGTHEFLYQSKERNEEFGLEQDDFEWRMYDFNFPRTTTIDPHAENYYSLSPYSWVGCNPLKYVDPDGRDFGVLIDRAKKAITIMAHFLTSSENKKAFDTYGAGRWNANSGKYMFIAGSIRDFKAGKAEAFRIDINITSEVVDGETINFTSPRDLKVDMDNIGTLNSFDVENDYPDNGGTSDDKISVKPTRLYTGTVTHETSHAMGNGHYDQDGSLSPTGGESVNKINIAETLKGVGIGGNTIERNKNSTIGGGTFLNGSTNKGLERGKVISINRYERIMKRIERRNNKN